MKKLFNKFIDINVLLIIAISLILLNLNSASFAQDVPKIRELPSDPASLNNQVFKNDPDNNYKSKDITKKLEKNLSIHSPNAKLKGGISELKAIVGKSQLIKFDNPITRVSITNPGLADLVILSPQEMLINGKAGGETSLIIWGESGDPVMFNLFVQSSSLYNFDNFVKEVKNLVPNDEIKIEIVDSGDKSSTKVALSGRISSTIQKDKIKNLAAAYGYTLIDNTEALTPQVMISIRVIEFTKSKTKSSGITPSVAATNSIKKYTSNLQFNANGTFSGTINSPDSLELTLQAAEAEGLARVLAEPKLMTVTGKAATFTSGDSIPTVTGRDAYGGLIVGSQNIGVNVTFTPTILEESGRILLDLTPSLTDYNATAIATVDGFPVYTTSTRSTHSVVELEDNQTIVIGGLIQKKTNSQKTQIPFLSHLPIIGDLLGKSTYTNDETELMIFVTPTIIKPDDVVNGV